MNICNKLELFILVLKTKINSSENKYPWYELLQWKSLETNVLNTILDKLSKISNNDYSLYNNYFKVHIDVNKNDLSEFIKIGLNNTLGISDDGKKIIYQYIDIFIDDEFDYNNYTDYDVLKIYLHKLMIFITEIWRQSDYSNIYLQTNELEQIMKSYNIKYIPNVSMDIFINSILYNKMYDNKDPIINDIIKYFKRLSKEYILFITLTNKNTQQSVKININENTQQSVKNKFQLYKNEIDNTDLMLKVGLINLCKKLEIDTTECRLKDDYLKKILEFKKNNTCLN